MFIFLFFLFFLFSVLFFVIFIGCLIGRVNTTGGLRPMAPLRGAAAHSAAPGPTVREGREAHDERSELSPPPAGG